jgi:molybdopterin/thiamine biosynthesis adenylyltransferase
MTTDSTIEGLKVNIECYRMDRAKEYRRFLTSLKKLLAELGEPVDKQTPPSELLSRATRVGIFRDPLDKLTEEAAKIGLAEDRVRSNSHIVAYPWRVFPRYVLLPEPSVYNQIIYSRNTCIISETTQAALARVNVGIAGLNMGGVAGMLLVRAGCTSITGVDGGLVDGKDLNRSGFGKAADIATPQATAFKKACLEVNPFCDIRVYAAYLGGKGLSVHGFVRRSDIIIDAMDSLDVKWDLRVEAKRAGKTVIMASDLGAACLLQVERPDTPPFFDRVSSKDMEVFRSNPKNVEAKTALAVAMIGGERHIPPGYMKAMYEARQRCLGFWPQVGEASHLSAAIIANTIRDYVDDRLQTKEVLVDLDAL